MKRPIIPTVEEIIDSSAYEAHMHFLLPDGSYRHLPAMVSQPYAEVAQEELSLFQPNRLTMWVDFYEFEVIDTIDHPKGKRYKVVKRQIGEVAVATAPQLLHTHAELGEMTSFEALWNGYYTRNMSRNSFGLPCHPTNALGERRLGPQKQEGNKSFIKGLAKAALADHPELRPWIKAIPL